MLTICKNLPTIADVLCPPPPLRPIAVAAAIGAVALSLGAGRSVWAAPETTTPAPAPAAVRSTPPAPAPVASPAAAPPPAAARTPDAPPTTSGASFGVLGIGPASLAPSFATELESAAATGLTASGATVVGQALTARPAGSCEDPTCLQSVAQTSGARYLLRGTCELDGSTYRVHLDLIDGSTGMVAVSRDDKCEICTEHDVVETTNMAASALKATFDSNAKSSAAAPRRTAPGTDLKPARERPMWLRAAPWVAFAAAAGAIATGVYYLSFGDSCADWSMNRCYRFYDTGLQGGLWLGAGAVAGALGVLALTLTPPSPAATGSSQATLGPARAAQTSPAGVSLSASGFAVWTTF